LSADESFILLYLYLIQPLQSAQYRDRAKERREKYGSPAIIPGWKRRLERELDKDPPVPLVTQPCA